MDPWTWQKGTRESYGLSGLSRRIQTLTESVGGSRITDEDRDDFFRNDTSVKSFFDGLENGEVQEEEEEGGGNAGVVDGGDDVANIRNVDDGTTEETGDDDGVIMEDGFKNQEFEEGGGDDDDAASIRNVEDGDDHARTSTDQDDHTNPEEFVENNDVKMDKHGDAGTQGKELAEDDAMKKEEIEGGADHTKAKEVELEDGLSTKYLQRDDKIDRKTEKSGEERQVLVQDGGDQIPQENILRLTDDDIFPLPSRDVKIGRKEFRRLQDDALRAKNIQRGDKIDKENQCRESSSDKTKKSDVIEGKESEETKNPDDRGTEEGVAEDLDIQDDANKNEIEHRGETDGQEGEDDGSAKTEVININNYDDHDQIQVQQQQVLEGQEIEGGADGQVHQEIEGGADGDQIQQADGDHLQQEIVEGGADGDQIQQADGDQIQQETVEGGADGDQVQQEIVEGGADGDQIQQADGDHLQQEIVEDGADGDQIQQADGDRVQQEIVEGAADGDQVQQETVEGGADGDQIQQADGDHLQQEIVEGGVDGDQIQQADGDHLQQEVVEGGADGDQVQQEVVEGNAVVVEAAGEEVVVDEDLRLADEDVFPKLSRDVKIGRKEFRRLKDEWRQRARP